MRKKDIPEALVGAVMSRYKGATTKVKVGTHLSEELEGIVGAHQGSVYHHSCLSLWLMLLRTR